MAWQASNLRSTLQKGSPRVAEVNNTYLCTSRPLQKWIIGLQALAGATRDAEGLSNVYADLIQLLETVQTSLKEWTDYFDVLDCQRTLSSYTPTLVESSRGRPKFDITREQLQHLRSLSFSWTAIADMLKVTRMTIYRRRVQYGMLDESCSVINDEELTEVVQQILRQHPQVGQTFG